MSSKHFHGHPYQLCFELKALFFSTIQVPEFPTKQTQWERESVVLRLNSILYFLSCASELPNEESRTKKKISVFSFVIFLSARPRWGIWLKFSILLNSIFLAPAYFVQLYPHLWFFAHHTRLPVFLLPSLSIYFITPQRNRRGLSHSAISFQPCCGESFIHCHSSPGAALPPAGTGSAVGDWLLLKAKAKLWVRLQNSIAHHFRVPISHAQRNAASYIEPGNC